MVKIICFIQARSTSRRYKNKIFKKILGLTLIEIIYSRIQNSKLLSGIYFLIPNNVKNKNLKYFLLKKKIPFFTGPENNVLSRFKNASEKIKSKIIVRVTADCPLVDGSLIDKCINDFIRNDYNYLCTRDGKFPLPDGLDVEIFKVKLLNNLIKKNLTKYDLEHVTPAIRRSIKIKNFIDFKIGQKIKKKYSIDNYYNYRIIKKIFMVNKKINFKINKTIKLLLSNEK